MKIVVCLLLLLSCSIAGQALPTSSLATDWQNGQIGGKAEGQGWSYNDRTKIPLLIRSAGGRSTAEPSETLVKRTSGSPSPLRWSHRRRRTDWQPVPPSPVHPAAPLAPDIVGGSTATPPHFPADGPSVPHTEPESSSKQPNKAKRRPPGTLKNNPALKAQANRERHDLNVQRILNGEPGNITKARGGKNAITTREEYRARKRANSKRFWRSHTKEEKVVLNKERTERYRQVRERKKAEQEGRIWHGPPARKRGRPRRNWEQEQEQAGPEEARQDAHADTRMEEATQHGEDGGHAPPGAHGPPAPLRQNTPELSSRFFTVAHVAHEVLPEATHQSFPLGPSSPSPNLRLSMSTHGWFTSGQGQTTHAQRQAAPQATSARVDESLALMLAPPAQLDGLRLTLAPPKHD